MGGEVQRVGGTGPADPKKEKASVDAEKFKELMKVQKVRETDPEEQKKRKKRQEEEDEGVQAPPPAAAPPPFSLEEKKRAASPFDVEKPTTVGPKQEKPSVLKGSLREMPPSEAPPPAPPPEEEDEDTFLQSLPSYTREPSSEETLPTYQIPSGKKTSSEKPLGGESTQPQGKKDKKRPLEKPLPDVGKKKAAAPKTPAQKPRLHEKEEVKTPISHPKKEEKEHFFETFGSKKTEEEQKTPEEVSQGLAPPPLTQPTAYGKKEKKEEESVASIIAPLETAMPQTPSPPPPPEVLASTPYAYLHPQVLELFERMVGVITVIQNTGIKETTLTLNTPKFASSVFYGARIIITEFSTAPYSLNVEIQTAPEGMNLLKANISDLMAAFQNGNYAFKINRLETTLLGTQKPLFKRKESISKDKGEKENR